MLISISLGMSSCQNDLDDKIEKLQKMEKEYVEACNDKDFDKARSIVTKMNPLLSEVAVDLDAYIEKEHSKISGPHNPFIDHSANYHETKAKKEALNAFLQVDTHVKYVNDKEIYDLLAHTSSDNNKRILFLYNSYEATQLPDMCDVIEVAISQDNEDLATKLIKAGVIPNDAVVNAAENQDMDDLVDLIKQKYPNDAVRNTAYDEYKKNLNKSKNKDYGEEILDVVPIE